MFITAIDPGTTKSGYVIWNNKTGVIHKALKVDNSDLLKSLRHTIYPSDVNLIEEINPYTMGKTTRDTILWSGRFQEAIESNGYDVVFLSRNYVRYALCGSSGSEINDSVLIQALVDRFAYGEKNYGKGTKNSPGFFFGFKGDIWQAFALAVAYALKLEA